jgi:hypothetical protein
MSSSHSSTIRHPNTVLDGRAIHAGYLLMIVLVFLFAANVYDPGGALRLKYAAIFLLCVTAIRTLKYFDLSSLEVIGGMLLFVVWPCWAFLLGTLRMGDVTIGVSEVTPFLFVLPLALLLPTVDRRTPLRLFYACLFSLAIFVVVTFGLIFLMPDSGVGSRVFEVLSSLQEKEGYFGGELMGDVSVPVLYFRSTLFLVPACVYFLFMGKVWRAGITFLALGLTWSKSGMFIAMVCGLVFLVRKLTLLATSSRGFTSGARRFRLFKILLPVVLLSGISLFILSSFPGFFDLILDTAAGESNTAQIRIGHYHSIMDLFARNPDYLIIGQGAGTSFFSSGESNYVRKIEITHLDGIRKFGLPWFLGFSALVFYSSWRLIGSKEMEAQGFGFALVSMYIAGGTNPVLFSPLFIILLTLCYFAQRPRLEISS